MLSTSDSGDITRLKILQFEYTGALLAGSDGRCEQLNTSSLLVVQCFRCLTLALMAWHNLVLISVATRSKLVNDPKTSRKSLISDGVVKTLVSTSFRTVLALSLGGLEDMQAASRVSVPMSALEYSL